MHALVLSSKHLLYLEIYSMSKFNMEISSVSNRENAVAEIWYNKILVS